jgi:hypothetical protein
MMYVLPYSIRPPVITKSSISVIALESGLSVGAFSKFYGNSTSSIGYCIIDLALLKGAKDDISDYGIIERVCDIFLLNAESFELKVILNSYWFWRSNPRLELLELTKVVLMLLFSLNAIAIARLLCSGFKKQLTRELYL